MAISFDTIPSNIKVPLFYAEISPKLAGVFQQNLRTLLIGQTVNVVNPSTPILIQSVDHARSLFGSGSMLQRMVKTYRDNDSFGEVWALPLPDAPASVAATGTMTFTIPTTIDSGTLHLYVAGQYIPVGVTSTDTVTSIAARVVTNCASNLDLPVTAANVAGVVTFTAKNKGILGNDIDIRVNALAEFGSQALPARLGLSIVNMNGGATDPSLATALTTLFDTPFEFYNHPYDDSTSHLAMKTFLDARWAYDKQLFGHSFTASIGSSGTLTGLGLSRNEQYQTYLGYNNSPTWSVEAGSMLTAQVAASLRIDPARTLQTLPLIGFIPPPQVSQFTLSERQTLLSNGITTLEYTAGLARIERVVTGYRINTFGQPDGSYLDITTLATLARISREVAGMVTNQFSRSKLAADGTSFGDGANIVTPKTIRVAMIGLYDRLIALGLCQSPDTFAAQLRVELDVTDPNRLNVLFPPILINNLVILATSIQFSLRF